MATPLAIQAAGGRVEFVDCNRDDLCMSFDDFERKVHEHKPHAVFLVHIGGHIAFDVEQIAAFCRAEGIVLIEDCAHAHGASWHGRRAGTWGDAGIWSFAATKTISTGEGGMLVSPHDELIEFARAFRNYGKPDYDAAGAQLPDERVHGRARRRRRRAARRDHGLEERGRARAARPACTRTASSCRTG